ncbi:Polycomb group protein EMBRYONIC FLOWER 2 [Spatholobus suberectus]|nr:Polycomb group protein EMBRYONIC FLOWER 2 [Spatholobus suberectus]
MFSSVIWNLNIRWISISELLNFQYMISIVGLLLQKISYISRFRSMFDIPETSSARMRAIPVAANETYSRSTDQPNHEDGWEHLSAEEKLAAEESLSVYCKPVELYNYLQQRAIDKPLFLQRCLDYRIRAKRKKRILMRVSWLWKDDKTRSLFPLCICLARLDPNNGAEGAQRYHFVRISTFRGPSGIDGNRNTKIKVNFMLPELDKLHVEANSGKYFVLIFASVESPISLSRVNASLMPLEMASNESRGGEKCLYGKVSLKDLLGRKTKFWSDIDLLPCILMYCLRRKSKSISIPDSRDSQVEVCSSISIQDSRDSQDEGELKQLKISHYVEEFGARENSPCRTHASREVASMSSSLSHILWLKEGNVSFNYRYYNNKLQRTEVTEDFSCAFCLVRCATYKGLKCHLSSSHDFFNFEFSEDCPSVYVSVTTDIWRLEIIAHDVDPRVQTFLYCAKPPKRREPKNVSHGRADDADQQLLDPEIPTGDTELLENANGLNAVVLHPGPDCVPSISDHDNGTHAMLQVDHEGVSNAILHSDPDCVPSISDHDNGTHAMLLVDHEGVSNAILHPDPDCVPSISDHDNGTHAVLHVDHEGVSNAILHPDLDCVPSISEHDHETPAVPQVGNKGKLSIEHYDPKIVARLKKRNFCHSHKYQAMELEEALVDEDSEDEINEEVQEIEDRRKLAILDATDNDKRFLPMWNSFIKKHRVLADGHMNWACEAFTKYHCAELAQSPTLAWHWRVFMFKLLIQGLQEARTINKCCIILEQYRKLNSDISQRLKKIRF